MKVYEVNAETINSDFLELEMSFDPNIILILCPPW